MAPLLLRAGHLAAHLEADHQRRPAGRHLQPADRERGGQRRLARHQHRRDPRGRRGRHRPRRQRREQDQLGAPPRRFLSDQREDRDPRRLRPELRHRRVRLDLRPRGHAEPARALHPEAERPEQLRLRVQPRAGAFGSGLRRSPARTDASRCRTASSARLLLDKQNVPALDAWNVTLQRAAHEHDVGRAGLRGQPQQPRLHRQRPGRELQRPDPGGLRHPEPEPAPALLRGPDRGSAARRPGRPRQLRRPLRLDPGHRLLLQLREDRLQVLPGQDHAALRQRLVAARPLHLPEAPRTTTAATSSSTPT